MLSDPNELKLAYPIIEKELSFSCIDSRDDTWMKAFAERVNDLILHDFNRLILILYRLDISEDKLRKLLKDKTPDDSIATAEIICGLIIERQIEKLRSRKHYPPDENINEEERW